MLIGHFGVALALKRVEPKINVGWLCLASLWLDILIWSFALLGIEQVIIPADYPRLHYLQFVFPYSHSVVAAVVWTVAAAAVGWFLIRRSNPFRIAIVMAAAMASHFVLDLIVHPPQLPVAGESSPRIGLGLWDQLPLALVFESAILAVGLWWYYRATNGRTTAGRVGPLILMIAVGVMALIGQAVSPTPPSATVVAVQGLGTIILITVLLSWFDVKRSVARL